MGMTIRSGKRPVETRSRPLPVRRLASFGDTDDPGDGQLDRRRAILASFGAGTSPEAPGAASLDRVDSTRLVKEHRGVAHHDHYREEASGRPANRLAPAEISPTSGA